MNKSAPYYKIAKEVLQTYRGYSEQEAQTIIDTYDRPQLESLVLAHGRVFDAAISMAKQMGVSDYEANQFAKEMLGLEDNFEATERIKDTLQTVMSITANSTTELMSNVEVEACKAVHSGWAQRNQADFFARNDIADQQYKYLPLELSGIDGLHRAMAVVGPIAKAVGMPIEQEQIEKTYNEKVLGYFKRAKENGGYGIDGIGDQGIDTIVEIVEALDKLGALQNLSPEIVYALKYDAALITQVALEIETKGIGADDALITMLQDQGILNSQNPIGLDYER